jgi:hypothetical protein
MPCLRRLPCVAAALLLALAACTAQPTAQPTGSVQFIASVPQAISATDVTRVKLTISATDMTTMVIELAKSNGAWGGIISNIPVGTNRTFAAEAYDSANNKIFQGSTSSITITAGQTPAVAITLMEMNPPPAYGNEAPIIESVVASSTTVQTNGTLTLTATARDPNTGDTLTYLWSSPNGTFTTSTAATATWTAPSTVGIRTLTLTVTDSQGAAAAVTLSVNVISTPSTGNASLTISFNTYPVVSKVSASLTRIDAGQATSVTATVSNPDGDTLTYQWTSSTGCSGTWTNATSATASFVPSSIPSNTCHNCRLSVAVQDGRGGQATGSINLCVAASGTERFAPIFTNAYQSATTTSNGQSASFEVTAMDSQSSALTFSWGASIGTLATAQTTATTSRIVWTAPSCAVTGVPATVTAIATNAYGVSATKNFTLSGLPACGSGWSTLASLITARYNHTATLLLSGKVLVTGGASTTGVLASAELYDPLTNTWTGAGTLAAARQNHTATLLNSGKVLIAGGNNGSTYPTSAELYDPATNSWSSAGPLTAGRYNHTATFLPSSGKVLVVGGINTSYLSSAELYDPTTNAWTSAGSMATPRYSHTATYMSATSKVLITGGNYGGQLSSAEQYNPATNTWTSAAGMGTARQDHTAIQLPSGKVLITGGYYTYWYDDETGNVTEYLASTQTYDPSNNTWASTSNMGQLRYRHAATLLASGKVLVTGGRTSSGGYHLATEAYDPNGNSWTDVGNMPSARSNHTATLLSSGRVMVIGGLNGSSLNTTAIYTP